MLQYIFISYDKIWYWIASYETVFHQIILLNFFNIIYCLYDTISYDKILHTSLLYNTNDDAICTKSSTISKAPFILHINRFILNKHVWISYGQYLLQYVRLQHTLWCFKINLPKHLDYQDHTPYLKLALYCIYIVKSTM